MSEAKHLEFVDSNVLIYAHDLSAGVKHDRAGELITGLWKTRAGAISIQVVQEFYVNITQKVPNPLSKEAATQIISNLGAWQVHQPGVDDIVDAIQLQTRYQLSFWDAMILTSAIALGCDVVWSEDLNSGQIYQKTVVKNPFI
jgi:predicted nucleic acid-binding protein